MDACMHSVVGYRTILCFVTGAINPAPSLACVVIRELERITVHTITTTYYIHADTYILLFMLYHGGEYCRRHRASPKSKRQRQRAAALACWELDSPPPATDASLVVLQGIFWSRITYPNTVYCTTSTDNLRKLFCRTFFRLCDLSSLYYLL